MLLALPDVPLRTTPFDVEDRWLLGAWMRMYPDRLVLAAWSFTGRLRRAIPLDQIAEVDHTDERLQLDVVEGERVALLVDEPARWARFIQAHRNVRDSSH